MAIYKILVFLLTLCVPASAYVIDNVRISGNTVSTLNTNGNLTFDLNGTGALIFSDLTATRVPYLDGSKKLVTSSVTPTELGYLTGVTSAIQTQLDAHQSALTSVATGGLFGLSGDVTATGNGGTAVATISNLAVSKLAALSTGRAVVTDGSGKISAGTTTATEIGYVNGVTSAIQTQINAKAPSASPTLTTPTIDVITLDDQGSTPANPSSGFYKVYAKTDGKVYKLNSTGVEAELGSSGAGGTNDMREYVTNGKFETDVTGWSLYNDSAAVPVDCTGGTTTGVTFTRTTTAGEVIRETASAELAKDASNRQGWGVSTDFVLDPIDYAGSMSIPVSFEYNTTSNYANADILVYVYDKDAGGTPQLVRIGASDESGKVYASTARRRFNGYFNPANTTSDDYRLCIHIATTNATAYDFHPDSVHIGNQNSVPGAIITEWVPYTPTFTGFGTVSSVQVYSRRNGDSLEIRGRFTAGTTTAVNGQISLGFNGANGGLTIAGSSKINSFTQVGSASLSSALGASIVLGATTGETTLRTALQSASVGGLNQANANSILNSSDSFGFFASVPISGWAASVTLSTSEAVFSTVKVKATSTAGTSLTTATETDIPFATETEDPLNAYNGTTFTAPKAGSYVFSVTAVIAGVSASTSQLAYFNLTDQSNTLLAVLTAGGLPLTGNNFFNGTKILKLAQGAQVKVRGYQANGSTRSLSTTAAHNMLEISEEPDFSVFSVYADRKVSFSANSSTTAATASTPFIYTVEDHDTYSAYNNATGVFTVPVGQGGVYQFGWITYTNANINAGLFVNGVLSGGGTQGSVNTSSTGTHLVTLSAGATVEIRPNGSGTAQGGAEYTRFYGFRVN